MAKTHSLKSYSASETSIFGQKENPSSLSRRRTRDLKSRLLVQMLYHRTTGDSWESI